MISEFPVKGEADGQDLHSWGTLTKTACKPPGPLLLTGYWGPFHPLSYDSGEQIKPLDVSPSTEKPGTSTRLSQVKCLLLCSAKVRKSSRRQSCLPRVSREGGPPD